VPDADARSSILQVLLSKTPHSIAPQDLHSAASRAHGYVGADLSAVVREAGTLAIKRWLAENPSPLSGIHPPPELVLTLSDLLTLLYDTLTSEARTMLYDSCERLSNGLFYIGAPLRGLESSRQKVSYYTALLDAARRFLSGLVLVRVALTLSL